MFGQSKFINLDILRVFLHINKKISRAELVKITTLSERSIRTILEILKKSKLVISKQGGHAFNKNGKKLFDEISKIIEIEYGQNLKKLFGNEQIAVLVKGYDLKQKIDYRIRDIAVMSGATGAMILVYKNKNLLTPPDNHSLYKEYGWLKDIFNFRQNNILIFAWGDSINSVERGALQIALTLNSKFKKVLMPLFKKTGWLKAYC